MLRASAYVTPALEIIDARIERFDRDTRGAAQGFRHHRGFCGERRHRARGPAGAARRASTCAGSARCSTRTAVIEETGLAAGVLNHPATGVAWLANKIAPYGEQLNAGDVVLSGSFTRPPRCEGGNVLHADFGRLARVSVHFRLRKPPSCSCRATRSKRRSRARRPQIGLWLGLADAYATEAACQHRI